MNQKGPSLSIRIINSNNPDNDESCKVLEINGNIVPFWLSQSKISQIQKTVSLNEESKNAILIQLMDLFLSVIKKCINRQMTISELMSAVETGVIIAGPPPENYQ